MKKGKSGIIFVLILLIVVLAGGAYAYIKTDLLKTPEQLFKKYFINGFIQVANMNIAPFDDVSERMEKELTQSNFNITINGDIAGEGTEGYKIDVNLNSDLQNKNESMDIAVKQDETLLLDGIIAVTGEKYGIKVPDIYNKYLVLENRDLKKLAENFGVDEETLKTIPDKITQTQPFTDEELELIDILTEKYMAKIYEPFGEEAYFAEKQVTTQVNGQNVVVNKYTFSVGSVALYNSVTKAIQELLVDPDFLTLCKDRVDTTVLEEFKTSFNDAIENASIDESDNVQILISVYESEQKTVKLDLRVEENLLEIELDNKETESTFIFKTTEPKDDYKQVGTINTFIIKNTFVNNQGELSVEVREEYNQDDIKTLNDADNEEDSSDTYFPDYNYADIYTDEFVRIIFKSTKTDNNTIKGNIVFEGDNLEDFNELVDIEYSIKFDPNIKVKKITSENAVVINDYTMEDFQALSKEIMLNIMNTATEKPESLIGLIFANMSTPPSMSPDTNYGWEDDIITDYDASTDITTEEPIDMDFSITENDENIYTPTVSLDPEDIKKQIDSEVTSGLNDCLGEYKRECLNNPDADLGIYLTVENLQELCPENYNLELLEDGATLKCTIDNADIYYAIMDINGDTLVVTDVTVYTEQEYLDR